MTNKKDIIFPLIIGELSSWFLLIIVKNLKITIPLWQLLPIVLPLLCFLGMLAASFVSKKIAVIYQLAKFVLIGAFNTFVDIGVLNILILLTGLASGIYYSLFKSISFSVAVVNSYFLNRFWTFEKTGSANAREFGSFLIVSLIGFAINVGTASLVVNLIGPKFGLNAALWANIGAVTAAMAGMTWNFLGYKLIVFKK